MKTYKPAVSAWLILAIICAPLVILSVVNIFLNPQQWLYALLMISGAAYIVGGNYTLRLVIDEEFITFKRFGRVVWRTPRRGVEFEDGRTGDIPVIPAIIIRRNGQKIGDISKVWFDEATMAALRAAALD